MLPPRLSALLRKPPPPKPVLQAPYPRVELFHWNPKDGSINFGDRLSEVVVRQVLARHGLSLDNQVRAAARLLAIGSILHFARAGDHIWGSGWNGKISAKQFTAEKLSVHAVRGPLTAEFLRARGVSVPDVYGDPATLLPALFPAEPKPEPRTDYVVIPNLNDLPLVMRHAQLVSPLWGWNVVLERIRQARLVLASSLHGLIVAESYGVPARYVRFSDTEDLFKYKDYFLGSGRAERDFVYATSIEEGLEMGGAPTPTADSSALLKAFPLELWR